MSEWLARGEASSDPDLRRFAEGIRRDEASVQAAVTERWSNGPVEGHVNRSEDDQAADVRPGGVRAPAGAGAQRRLKERSGDDTAGTRAAAVIESAGEPVCVPPTRPPLRKGE